MSSLWVNALGVAIQIRFTGDIPPEVADAWQDAAIQEPEDTAGSVTISVATPDHLGDEFGDSLASRVTIRAIAANLGSTFMFHACAVALPDGRVVGFVGPSGRGKTTLASTIAKQYGYVTDETLAVRVDGTVLPYRKPLSIGRRPGVKRTIAPSALGLQTLPHAPLRLAALVLLDRRPDSGDTRVEHVGLAEAMSALSAETSSLRAMRKPLLDLAKMIHSTGGVRRLVYADNADLDEVIDLVLTAARHDHEELWPVETAASSSSPGHYSRTSFDDALAVDDDLLVLRPAGLAVLSGLGPVLWRTANDASFEDLTVAALRELPDPPPGTDARAAVAEALDALLAAGLLQHGS